MKPDGRLLAALLLVALAGCGSGGAAPPMAAKTTDEPTSAATPQTSDATPADRPVEPQPAASGTLAYVLDGDIYVADPDGSNAVRIANGRPDEDCTGRFDGRSYGAEGSMWSPDGRYLAYRYGDCSDPKIGGEISDTEGNVLAKFPHQGWEIAWSPDSTRVAVWDHFSYEPNDPPVIAVFGLDGARLAQLTMPPGWTPSGDHDPKWMPDGKSVWVEKWELPLDGSTPRQLPSRGGDPYATYSPDGSLVAYSTHGSLTVARSDGSEPREVFDEGSYGGDWGHPWSATSDQIAFATDGHGRAWWSAELRVVDVATGSVTLLTEGERGVSLHAIGFSPQGDRILFRKDEGNVNSLWSIGVDGSDARLVVAGTWQGEWLSR